MHALGWALGAEVAGCRDGGEPCRQGSRRCCLHPRQIPLWRATVPTTPEVPSPTLTVGDLRRWQNQGLMFGVAFLLLLFIYILPNSFCRHQLLTELTREIRTTPIPADVCELCMWLQERWNTNASGLLRAQEWQKCPRAFCL